MIKRETESGSTIMASFLQAAYFFQVTIGLIVWFSFFSNVKTNIGWAYVNHKVQNVICCMYSYKPGSSVYRMLYIQSVDEM